MAYTAVNLPLTGAGDATAAPAVDLIGGQAFQAIKLFDGTEGSTVPVIVLATTPGSTDPGMVVRVAGGVTVSPSSQLTVTVGNPTSGVDANLTSIGSTRLIGKVDVNNPTTAVSLSSVHTVTVGNPTTAVEANLSSLGSTRLVGKVDVNNPTTAVSLSSVHTFTVGNPTTAVEANLSSIGSTKLVGKVDVNNPTTAFSLSSQITITVGNPTTSVTLTSGVILGAGSSANMLGQVYATGTTKVDVSSGVILGAGSSANMLGQVQATGTTKVDVSSGVILAAGSSANVIGSVTLSSVTTAITVGSVALLGGSSANMLGTVVISSGTTGITVGSVALLAGSSANILGQAVQGPGSTANFWYTQPLPFSSAQMARTTVNTSVDVAVIAANANRKALVIANLSTVQIVGLGMSTGAVTTALANINVFLQPNSQLIFGYSGGLPLFTGPFRGINISSTTVAGGVAVMEFT